MRAVVVDFPFEDEARVAVSCAREDIVRFVLELAILMAVELAALKHMQRSSVALERRSAD